MAVALTSLSHGAGCGCKLPAAALRPIVADLPRPTIRACSSPPTPPTTPASSSSPTTSRSCRPSDFFTPIVDDPYWFGRIAATNALSDVYAMGGRPVSALNLVAFPLETLGPDVLREILRGGADAAAAAGASIVGGHSIDDPEPKYGMAVTGVVAPARRADQRRRPAGRRARADEAARRRRGRDGDQARPGRRRAGRARDRRDDARSNDRAAEQARAAGAHALTDVTGFGLLGHVHELAAASGLAAEIDAAAIPAIDGVLELLADDRAVAGGSRRNRADAGGLHDVRRRRAGAAAPAGVATR